jgi:DNA modification methylase
MEALSEYDTKEETYTMTTHTHDGWTLHHGDCVEGVAKVADNSIGLVVYSPPFQNLFQYNASERDMGNTRDSDEFFAHHTFLADNLMRVLMPGRLIAMHVMQVPAMLVRDGWIGLHDFRGKMIAHMQERGFIYAGEVTCAKSPQAQAIRIRAKGLAFNQLHKDSAWSRPCLNDYIILFRKPGENPTPVKPDIDNNTWIVWASGIWVSTYYDSEDGYRETYTLNVAEGRDADDTKHICPLPLDLVERCVRLWSNPGETVLDPFSGLGTTGVKALEYHRRYIGCELKDSYVKAQLVNLQRAESSLTQGSLF